MNFVEQIIALVNSDWILSFLWKLVLSAILGALLGWERSSKQPVAGINTHMIIACGSCLISACGAQLVVLHPGSGDATRLAGQILTGIGFVGAGVIIRRGVGVTTTAATIFLSAGLGIACGLGFYSFAALSTILVVGGLKITYKFFPREELPGKTLKVVCTKDKLEQIKALLPVGSRMNSVVKHDNKVDVRFYISDLSWFELDKLMQTMLANGDVVSVQMSEDKVV